MNLEYQLQVMTRTSFGWLGFLTDDLAHILTRRDRLVSFPGVGQLRSALKVC